MKNLKIGSKVYHFLRMGRIGTITKIERSPTTVMTTEGSLSSHTVVTVAYSDGTLERHQPGDLMRADR